MLGKVVKYIAVPVILGALSIGAGYFYLAEEDKDAVEQEEGEEREKSRKRDLEYLLKVLKQQKRMSAVISYYYSHRHENDPLSLDQMLDSSSGKSECDKEESKDYE